MRNEVYFTHARKKYVWTRSATPGEWNIAIIPAPGLHRPLLPEAITPELMDAVELALAGPVRFEELSLGEQFISGGRRYVKTDDSEAREVPRVPGTTPFHVAQWETVERASDEVGEYTGVTG